MKSLILPGLAAALIAVASRSPAAGPPATVVPSAPDGGSPEEGPRGAEGAGEDERLLEEIEAATSARPAATMLSNAFNPAMSLNGLFLGSFTSARNPTEEQIRTGIAIQEVELQFLANVDPYLSASMSLSLPAGEGVSVEEGFLSLTARPLGIAFRAGKLKVPFGRENALHTHALPFVDRSLAVEAVFGEALAEVGVEGSYLVPVPWYLLVTGSVLEGSNEVAFGSPDGRDVEGFAALKNVVDLTGDATLELGAAYTLGRNADRLLSQVAGAHLVVKWKPAAQATTRSAVLTVEGLYSRVPRPDATLGPDTDTYGLYTFAQWQLERRWHIGGRLEFLRPPGVDPSMVRRGSAILVYVPTELSAVRLQANVTQPGPGLDPVFDAFLQVNFTLGPHPAHTY